VDYRINSTSQCPHYAHGLNPHSIRTSVTSFIFLPIFCIFFYWVWYLPKKLITRKMILKFNLYIQVLNLDHMFNCWIINAIDLKVYKKPNFSKMRYVSYEINNRIPHPIHSIFTNTTFFFSPNTLKNCIAQYNIRSL
jgi:hypothetical protein